MKATLIRLGIRGFNPKLKKAAGRLEDLRTPEDEPIPPNTMAELRRDMDRRRLVSDQIRQIEEARLDRLKQVPDDGPHAMLRLLARVIGVGIETADMLVQEVLARNMRDRRAIARCAGLTGSPDESGTKRREKGLARSGNARVRRGMIQLAWRFLLLPGKRHGTLRRWHLAGSGAYGSGRRRAAGPSSGRSKAQVVAAISLGIARAQRHPVMRCSTIADWG